MEKWNDKTIKNLTIYLQQYDPQWSESQTEQMLQESESAGEYSRTFFNEKGMLRIKIMGDTVLVNGKDITGNLGSKTTHGDYSPIIENVENSNIAIGDNNIINSNYQVLYNELKDLKQNISSNAKVLNNEKTTMIADIETIQSQLRKEKPSMNIVKEAWEGIKKVLKAYGYAKQIAEIGALIASLFGVL